jgi:iron(III) transport system ATP-binding protein
MLSLNKLSIRYGNKQVVDNLSFHLDKGEIACLLGPSGCGKSSVLKAIAGFVAIAQGDLSIREQLVSRQNYSMPAEKRGVGLVFQGGSLFPHLTVAQNICFGLYSQSKAQQQARLDELVSLVELQDLTYHYTHQLSGGQQQRVALARALAPKPDVLLLDEPFSGLDRELRSELAMEIRVILEKEETTALMVTHDQYEAFAFADSIGVMGKGKLQQWGSAHQLYHQPNCQFVGEFIGKGVLLAARLVDDTIQSSVGDFKMNMGTDTAKQNHTGKLLVRPEQVKLATRDGLNAQVTQCWFQGAHTLCELRLTSCSERLLCEEPLINKVKTGDLISVSVQLPDPIFFPD